MSRLQIIPDGFSSRLEPIALIVYIVQWVAADCGVTVASRLSLQKTVLCSELLSLSFAKVGKDALLFLVVCSELLSSFKKILQ